MKTVGTQHPPIHIDARPGGTGLFSPPQEVDNYAEWLLANVKACERPSGKHTLCHGIAQQLQHTVASGRAGAKVRVTGHYGGALAAVIEGMVLSGISDEALQQMGGTFEVEVLG